MTSIRITYATCEFPSRQEAEAWAVSMAILGWRLVGIFSDPERGYRAVMETL